MFRDTIFILTVLLFKSTLQYEQKIQNNAQNIIKDSETIVSSVNVTECIELKNAYLNFNNVTMNSSSEEAQLPPLNRITVISQDDLHQLCALLEFRGYFLVTYTNNDTKETVCYRIPIDLKEKYSSSNDEIVDILEKSFTNNHHNNNSNVNFLNGHNKSKPPSMEPDNVIILTTNSTCCNNFLRCFSLSLNSNDGNEYNLMTNWTIDFFWNRTPEMYEFGEEGWSSVGTPVGALSGVYDLIDVKLKYHFDKKFGFNFITSEDDNKDYIVHSLAEKRLQARVGDYYECISEIQLIFDTENATIVHGNDETSLNYNKSSIINHWNILMSLRSVRSQAFADVNVPEFTGASVVCAGDVSHDMSLSIAIGLSLCCLVICVLFGLAINHLRQKDEVFKPVDTRGEDDPKS
ncbi:unnamed protein product [Schistosoma turkestanicum]|nr:unnamed protein product [Schistosoma turkestanicum]